MSCFGMVCRGGPDGDVTVMKALETLLRGGGNERNAKDAARRGADGFGIPRAHGSGQAHNAGCAKGLGGAQNCAEVARVLESGKNKNQRRAAVMGNKDV